MKRSNRYLPKQIISTQTSIRIVSSLCIVFLLFVFSNCETNNPNPPASKRSVNFSVAYSIDGLPLIFDSLKYINAAANKYSVTSLNYYLSGFSFLQSNGSGYSNEAVYYIDGRKPETNSFVFADLPAGSYSGLSFYLGLNANKNKTNSLPNTLENQIMAWPVPMGGGYHFIKFEGHFLDSNDTQTGFAIHLGKNENVVKITLIKKIEIGDNDTDLKLEMNLNEFFKNPLIYDLIKEPSYTMSDGSAMKKISNNAVDVFTFK